MDIVRRRHSTKKFDANRVIDDQTLGKILEAFRFSPSMANIQPWGCVVVTDPEIRRQLQPYSYNQPQIVDASHLLVLCRRTDIDEDWLERVEDRWLKELQKHILEKEADHLDVWANSQVYVALGTMLATCAAIGVDTCAIGLFDHEKYDEILWLTEKGLASCVALAVGYEKDGIKHWPKTRFAEEDVIFRV